jgi:phenylalanine-4-hydroxylase
VIHEVIGHCNSLANSAFADLYAVAGAASRRADDDDLVRFSKTFWYTLEFGVVWQDGDLKAYGAGLLSSFGEMNAYRDAEIREWDPDAMAVMEYDIDVYQPVLFAAPDFDTVVVDLTAWFDSI